VPKVVSLVPIVLQKSLGNHASHAVYPAIRIPVLVSLIRGIAFLKAPSQEIGF